MDKWQEGSWIDDSPYFPPTTPDYVWIYWKTLEKYEGHLECCPKRSAVVLLRSIQAYRNARASDKEAEAVKQRWFYMPAEVPGIPEYE